VLQNFLECFKPKVLTKKCVNGPFNTGHHDGSEEFAHCQIRGGGAGGHVCFKEQVSYYKYL